ncbi:Type cbb3 cytochrome oxidase biogenesis protein CcoG, involved in Cu oxidation [plant metagenome]|uniref:Type cbb3 cytochrome oxidase biogenesis protein CcoG, involved in Cu oxidation n=1 Tax=plant metagenome TaxID=1297885 RepID=A0A484SNI7_9ZZZZ
MSNASASDSASRPAPAAIARKRRGGEATLSADSLEQTLADVRRKIYPRSVSGLYARWRIALVFLTQFLYYGLPWVNWNGRQAVLFDLGARKFYIFGMVLWPQDVIYLAVLLVISALALFLFTAVAGRLFCGYACPQTVYTEIFMWIERRIEGDRVARIRLDGDPWSVRKVRIKATKHAAWLLVAGWTGFTFIGYFAPMRELGSALAAFSLGPWQWFWMVFYAFCTWGNAGFLREQVCKYMCPYARFQSVMVDPNTWVVTYDQQRGDPRGGRSRKIDHHAQGLGDCVDCSLCVQVCPTGIDIRDGLQYMCIGCGACADACDAVMDKMQYPQGLIRYASERSVQDKLTPAQARRQLFRPRVLIYSALILVLVAIFLGSLATRTPLRIDVIRDRASLGREVAGGLIENVYRLQLINVSEGDMTLTLRAEGLPGLTVQNGGVIHLDPASNRLLPVVLQVPAQNLEPGPHTVHFRAQAQDADGRTIELEEKASFIVPR